MRETVDAVVINGHRIILEKWTSEQGYGSRLSIVHDMEPPRIVRHVGKKDYVLRMWRKKFKPRDES